MCPVFHILTLISSVPGSTPMQSSSAGTFSTLRGMKENDATSRQEEKKKKNHPTYSLEHCFTDPTGSVCVWTGLFRSKRVNGPPECRQTPGLILFWGQRGKSLPPEEYFRTHTISISRAIEGRPRSPNWRILLIGAVLD